MASLLSTAEKSALRGYIDDVADTFERAVIIYKDATVTVTTPNDSFNSLYGNTGSSTSVTYTEQPSTIYARIKYKPEMSESNLINKEIESQLKLNWPDGNVRLKIKAADYEAVKEAKRLEFDGRKFLVDSDFRGHGLFGVDYYTFFVKPMS